MSNVDERIVRMQFDGKGFEAGANRAIGILDKLSESLKFKNGSKGLESIQDASNKFNMNGVSNGITIVSEQFSLFHEFVTGIFRRLGERAADFGMNLAKSVSVKPMMAGFSEYELQMKSIQTISANTGLAGDKGIAKINEALDELNVYADKTIYNFSEMTRNIGTFTAAGVDLKTSTKAIQGIANLAAVSGSNSQQASTAMYQLSQALASGTVKLQDWNSVVNAGMGGKVFQEALKRTARAHGIAVDDMIKKNGSFRESLQEGWITSEVLTDTLNQLAISYEEVGDETYNAAYAKLLDEGYSKKDAKEILRLAKSAEEAATMVRTWTQLWDTVGEALGSGWSASFRIIIGDFQKATELFTWLSQKISGIVEESSNARNEVLKQWAENGGRDALVGSIANIFTAIERPLRAIADSFSAVFGISGKELAVITEDFARFTEKLVITEQQADYLAGTFDILFGILSGAISVVSRVASYFGDFASSIFSALQHANAFRRIAKIIKNVSKAIYRPLKAIGTAFAEVFNFDDVFSGKAAGVIGRALRFFENLSKSLIISKKSAKKLHDTFKDLFTIVSNLLGPVENVGKSFQDFFNNLSKNIKDSNFLDGFINTITETFSKIDFGSLFGKIKIGAGLGGLGLIGKFIKDVLDKVSELKEGLNPLSGINGIFDKIGSSLETWQKNLKVDTITKIAISIGIVAASIFALSKIPQDKVLSTLELFTGAIAGLLGAFAGFNKLGGGKFGPAVSLLLVASSILVLSFALTRLKDLNLEQLGKGLAGIGGMLLELMLALNNMPDSGRILSSAVAMLIMSVAIGALSLSMKLLSTMSWEDIGKGLATIAGLLIEFTLALNNMPDSGRILSSAVAMLMMSVAIGALSLSMKLLSTISWEDIGKGLTTIAALLIGFTLALNNMPDSGRILSSAVAMLMMSVAIGALSLSMKLLSTISWEGIGKGLGSIAVLLIELGVALSVFQANIGGAAAMLLVSVAVAALAVSMKLLSTINFESIVNSLLAMAGMLTILGVALAVFQANIGGAVAMLIASVAMIALAGALNLLVPALQSLGQMSLAEIGIALLGLAGAFTVLGIAGALLSGAVLPSLAFTAAIVGLAAAAYLLANALAILIPAITPVVSALVDIGGNIVKGLVEGFNSFVGLLGGLATTIFNAIVNGVKSLFGIHSPSTVMSDIGGNVVQGLINGINGFLGSLSSKAGEIVSSVLNGLGDFAGKMTTKAGEARDALINGLNAIKDKALEAGKNAVSGFVNGIGESISTVTSKAQELGNSFLSSIKGFLGIQSPSTIMNEVGQNTTQGFIDGLGDSSLLSTLSSVATTLGSTISDGIGWLTGAIGGLAEGVGSAFTSTFGSYAPEAGAQAGLIASSVSTTMEGMATGGVSVAGKYASNFASGLGSQNNQIKSKSKAIKDNAVNPLKPLANEMRTQGRKGVDAFVKALASGAGAARAASRAMINGAKSGLGSLYNSFHTVGRDAMQGFINGMNSKGSAVWNTAYQLGRSAVKAAKAATKEKSPSKEFREIGFFVGEGFILGMKSEIPKTYAMGTKLAETVPDAFSDTLGALSLSIDDLLDTDYNPVITPVINSTEFDSGMYRLSSAINGRLGDISVGNLNYTGELSSQLSDYNDINRRAIDLMAENTLDYNLLGVAVANALINAGVHVEMDGGQLMGYLAGEISDARRMYGTR